MPRLNVVNPAEATGKAKELFDGPLRGKHLNIFKGIANNPNVLEAFANFSGAVKSAGSLSPKEHELIALATGAVNGCDYCTAAHSKAAAGLGLTDDQISHARNFQADDQRDQAVLNFARAVVERKGYVTEKELTEFRNAGFDDAAVVEVVAAVAVNTFTNLFNHVNETEIDPIFQAAGANA